MLDPQIIEEYISILQQELIPATGCTEPIALAYAAAVCKKALGGMPEAVEAVSNTLSSVLKMASPAATWMARRFSHSCS